MAAEKIKVFELELDVDAALTNQEILKKRLDASKSSLDALKKSGDTASRTYLELDANVKALNKEYSASQNQIGKMIQLQGKEIKTIEQGRNALSILNREWAKQASLYGENSVQAEKLANKTKDVRERLKELEKGVGDNTRNVGNYSEGFKEAITQTGLFGRAQEVLGKGQAAVAAGTKLANGALGSFKKALIASGVGVIVVALGALVGLLGVMKSSLSKTEEGQAKLNKISAVFSGILNGIFKVLEPLANFIFDKVVVAFETLSDAAELATSTIEKGLRFLGFDDAADKVNKFTNEIKASVKATQEFEEANSRLLQTQREQEITQLKFQRQAEKLRQIRDDESKSIEQRKAANEELGQVLDRQIQTELTLAKQALEVADLRIKAEGKSTEALDQRAEALTKIEEIQERVEGQRSEQLTNENSLLKEQRQTALENAQKISEAALKESKTRLQIFIEETKGRSESLEQGLSKEEEIRDRRLAILQQEVKAGKKTQTEAELERLQIKNDFLEKQKELTVQFAQEELDIYLSTHQSRIDANQLLSDALVDQEIERLNRVAEAEREFQATRLAEGEINQRQYNEAIAAIDEEARLAKEELQIELAEQRKEQEIVDLENERIANAEKLDFDREYALQQYELGYQQRKDAAIKAGTDLTKFEAAEAKTRQAIELQVQQNKAQLASDAFGNIANIVGKETELGKAAAIAQTTIDTYKAAQSAYAALAGIPTVGPVLGAIAAAAAVASGIANVKKITSTSVPKAEKGAVFDIGGKRHSAGGTKFYGEDGTQFEAEQGEVLAVLNRNAAMAFHGLNSAFPAGGNKGSNYFATGGLVQRAVNSQVQGQSVQIKTPVFDSASMDQLAGKIAEANKQLPSPITDVKDVIGQVDKYNKLVDGANI